MTDKQLSELLRKLKINTKSMACLGCEHENGCTTKGCRLIGLAADRLATYEQAIEIIKAAYKESSGSEKCLLQDVIALFDPAYDNPSNLRNHIAQQQKQYPRIDAIDSLRYALTLTPPKKLIHDFELCADPSELADTLRCIDESGYEMIGITQKASGVYTVFFRRPANE